MNSILISGCGDIALRIAPLLRTRYRVFGLLRDESRKPVLRNAGITPLMGDLDDRGSLSRIAGLADVVLHLAPPQQDGERDLRTCNLLAAISQGVLPQRFVYISTSGVYGDCNGDAVQETRPIHPHNARARRRADAEQQIRRWAKRNRVNANILRVPGIYAADRLPLERIRQGSPLVVASEDGYTNHIHADDLAHVVVSALRYAKPNRVYHASDDSELRMGDYFDAVADAYGLPRPPRVSRAEAQQVLSPLLLSFMNESRRLSNARMKRELNVALRYSTVADMLRGA